MGFGGETHDGQVRQQVRGALRRAHRLVRLGILWILSLRRRRRHLRPSPSDRQCELAGLRTGAQCLRDRVQQGEIGVQDLGRTRGGRGVAQCGSAAPACRFGGDLDETRVEERIEVLAHGVVVKVQCGGHLGRGHRPTGGLDEFENPATGDCQLSARRQVHPGGTRQARRDIRHVVSLAGAISLAQSLRLVPGCRRRPGARPVRTDIDAECGVSGHRDRVSVPSGMILGLGDV